MEFLKLFLNNLFLILFILYYHAHAMIYCLVCLEVVIFT